MAKNNDPRRLLAVTDALNEILTQYPRIRPAHIETFIPVYYPIAMVEMQMQEHTFEDFETVHLAVLRLVALGIREPELIAATLSLTAGYVEKVMHLLTGFGHLQGGDLTPLGQESLNQGKKITLKETMQTFQVDALNGTLLKLPKTVAEKSLAQLEQTTIKIGHLGSLEGISEDVIRGQLEGDRGMDYIYHNADILHANVSSIRDVRCTQICFAQSYLMKLTEQTVPIVFAKRYDKTQKLLRDRFSWQPYSISNPQVAQRWGFKENTPISTAPANESLLQMQRMLADALAHTDIPENAMMDLHIAYGLDPAGLQLQPEGAQLVVRIHENAFTTPRFAALRLFRDAYIQQQLPIASGYLYGMLMRLCLDSPKLQLLGQLLDTVAPEERKDLEKGLVNRFKEYDGTLPLADAMIQAIQESRSEEVT